MAKPKLNELLNRLNDRSARHHAIEALCDSWGMETAEAIGFLMETVVGLAVVNKRDELPMEEVFTMLVEVWAGKIETARAGARKYEKFKAALDAGLNPNHPKEGSKPS